MHLMPRLGGGGSCTTASASVPPFCKSVHVQAMDGEVDVISKKPGHAGHGQVRTVGVATGVSTLLQSLRDCFGPGALLWTEHNGKPREKLRQMLDNDCLTLGATYEYHAATGMHVRHDGMLWYVHALHEVPRSDIHIQGSWFGVYDAPAVPFVPSLLHDMATTVRPS